MVSTTTFSLSAISFLPNDITGTVKLHNVKVVDTLPEGRMEVTEGAMYAAYSVMQPGEQRSFSYTVKSDELDAYTLPPASATYSFAAAKFSTKSNSPAFQYSPEQEKISVSIGPLHLGDLGGFLSVLPPLPIPFPIPIPTSLLIVIAAAVGMIGWAVWKKLR